MALTVKEQRLVDEYLIDANATRAAIAAGYSAKAAHAIAYETLRKPEVAAALAERQLALRQKLHITQEDVLREAAWLAFSDIRNIATFSNERGVQFHDSNEMSDAAAHTIAEVTSKVSYRPGEKGGESTVVEERRVKMYPKLESLKLVAQLIGAIAPPGQTNITQQNLTLPSGMSVEDLVTLRNDLRRMTVGPEDV